MPAQRNLAAPDASPQQKAHPRALAPATLALILLLSLAGALIGIRLIATLGITPNTSIIGAMTAMALARLPLALSHRFRSPHVQNLAQSAMSSATFGAANCLLLPIGIPFVLGRPDLVLPLLAGVALAMILDGYMLYRLYGSSIFPSAGAWPPGVAAAETIRAGDGGGRGVRMLGLGAAVGIAGGAAGIPMLAFGVAFIGSAPALLAFGIGLLLKGYAGLFAGTPLPELVDAAGLDAALLPHGMMIGAAAVALVQMAAKLSRRRTESVLAAAGTASRTLAGGFLAYTAIAAFVALAGGLASELSLPLLFAFILYAAAAALVHELIVGISAMHSGWFPAFALALVTLMIGLALGFPPLALALLAGFTAATGPAFADMGYDLKTGTLLRAGLGEEFERDGRRQQFLSSLFAFAVAVLVVLFSWRDLFEDGLIPPIDHVYAAVIEAGMQAHTVESLAAWALPGALLQWAGGPGRQLGVLFATGLLLGTAAAGFAVLVGLAVRFLWQRLDPSAEQARHVFGGGVIAGDALFGVAQGVWDGIYAEENRV